MDKQSEKKRAKLVELKNKLLDGQHVQSEVKPFNYDHTTLLR